MSFVGISPTDIVKGAAAGRKAVNALKNDEDGSKHHYQQAKRALAHRVRALEELSASTAKTSPEIVVENEPLLDEDISFHQSLGSYEWALGRGAPLGRRHGIFRKLRFAFDGHNDVDAHLASSRPAVDAAIFRGMR